MSRDRETLEEKLKRIRREIINSNSSDYHLIPYNNREESNNIIMGRRTVQSFGIQNTGTVLNTITPCAACKLLRRRCAEECPFSPYFSPQEPHKFAAVHKVFGASNVSKMLLELPEGQRADAANSLVYEANLRLRDPVYGCMGLISALQQQIQTLQTELNAIRTDILRHKYREATTQIIVPSPTTNNNTNLVSHHHNHHLISVASNTVQAAIPPSTPPPPPPQQTAPPPPSVVVSPSSTSSNSSLYTTPSTNTTGYSSISSDNVPNYFD